METRRAVSGSWLDKLNGVRVFKIFRGAESIACANSRLYSSLLIFRIPRKNFGSTRVAALEQPRQAQSRNEVAYGVATYGIDCTSELRNDNGGLSNQRVTAAKYVETLVTNYCSRLASTPGPTRRA